MSGGSHEPSNAARLQMEQSIDRLAEMAREGIEPAQFFSAVLGCAVESGDARSAILWRRTQESRWQIAGEVPSDKIRQSDFIEQRQPILDEAAKSNSPYMLKDGAGTPNSASYRDRADPSELFSPIRQSTSIVGILETVHERNGRGEIPADTIPFFTALCEVTADFLLQQELQQLRHAQQQWHQWDQYAQSLWNSIDLSTVCNVIANDGWMLADCDRVSVLIREGRSFRLQSASGVSQIDPRSSAARSLESLAELTAKQSSAVWWPPTDDHNTAPIEAETSAFLTQYSRDSGAQGIGVVPITTATTANVPGRSRAVFVLESFRPRDDFANWRSRGELLAARSGPALRAACEIKEIPWLGLWKTVRRISGEWMSPAMAAWLILAAVVIGGLVVIPADFTVSGAAEIWPARRRDVFAASSGIVDRILVAHGEDVTKEQPLIVLRDPELESDAPRILGEIATLNERLKGVQAARFIGNSAPESNSRSRQLTADEEELKERLQTLERQRALVEERTGNLTLRSPIAGKVLTWDVDQLLSARPVERGQILLTIGDTAGPWIVEVRVPDRQASHLLRAWKSGNPELPVDFLLTSEPGRTFHGHVKNVSLNSEIDDATRSYVRVVVAVERDQIDHPRPGATAIPRIHCCRRSLGYVWLHDLIDAIRTRLLF